MHLSVYSWGHSYVIVRGEILKNEQVRKHLPSMFSRIKVWGSKMIIVS